eukprot:2203977-Rhodomonas_salina.1
MLLKSSVTIVATRNQKKEAGVEKRRARQFAVLLALRGAPEQLDRPHGLDFCCCAQEFTSLDCWWSVCLLTVQEAETGLENY